VRLRAILSTLLAIVGLTAGATIVRADYVVLRSGARLNVTGYELLGDKYRLQLDGGVAEVPASDVVGIEPEEVFEPLPPPLNPSTPYHDLILAASQHHGVDADLIHCVIAIESNFDPKAVSPKNARGLMQLLPQTAAQLGVRDVFDPQENIEAGTRYLKEMLARYNNNLTLALAAYNAGPEKVEQYGWRVPPYSETVKYVRRISRSYAHFKSGAPQNNKPQTTAKVEGLPAGK